MQTELTDFGDGGLWLSITELARRQGVGKPTISERVKALEAAGLIKTRAGRGKSKLVNLAQFLTAVGQVGDAAKELAAEARAAETSSAPAPSPGAPTYRDAQTRKIRFEADLAEIALAQKRGELVPVAEVEEAAERVAEAINRVMDRLASYAEAMAAAVGKDGVPGARAMFKEISRAQREAAAEAMQQLAERPDAPPATGAAAPTL